MKTTNHEMMNRFFPARGNMAPDPRHARKTPDAWKLDEDRTDADDKMEMRRNKAKASARRDMKDE